MEKIVIVLMMLSCVTHIKSMDDLSGSKKRTYEEFAAHKIMIDHILNPHDMQDHPLQEVEEYQQAKRKKTYVCEYEECGRICNSQKALEIHTRIHTGEKLAQCEICGKELSTKGALKMHIIMVHAEGKVYACKREHCNQVFRTEEELKQHKEMHIGEKPFVCKIEGCEAAFTKRSNLETHKKTHIGESTWTCDFEGCGKVYRTVGNLNRHKNTHTQEKKYICEICNGEFLRKDRLKIHINTHTKEHSFTCTYEGCGKIFTQNSSLNHHKKNAGHI